MNRLVRQTRSATGKNRVRDVLAVSMSEGNYILRVHASLMVAIGKKKNSEHIYRPGLMNIYQAGLAKDDIIYNAFSK